MAIVRSIKMICANIDANNNKFWDAELHDDGMVHICYGRVGYSGTKESRPGGQKFLDSKIREKEKKGYTKFEGINADAGRIVVSNEKINLQEVAKKQIQFNSPQLEKLTERLAVANVHNIISNSTITYDAKTGLFSTPRGILTPAMIADARALLAEIKLEISNLNGTTGAMEASKIEDGIKQDVQKYLMLVPKSIGMGKFDVNKIFPDQNAFDKENNILDSLEASYASFVAKDPISESSVKIDQPKVFDVQLDVLTDKNEFERIAHWFESSKKAVHGYGKVKIVNAYSVNIGDMTKNFEEKGKLLGGIEKIFHGTSEANLLSILKSGLRVSPPSTAFIAGKMFGNGVYGAIESSKALGYTLGRWGNSVSSSGWVFICEFAMGKTYDPTRSGNPPKGYDSTWAKAKKCGLMHDELIVYSNYQIKITHLLEVKQ